MISDTKRYRLYLQKNFEPGETFFGEYAAVEDENGIHFRITDYNGGFLPEKHFQLTIVPEK